MSDHRKRLGAWGEQLAVEHLKKLKYKIRETNFRCSYGEIDIVAEDKDCLVFVEVRTRTSSNLGTPEESITRVKQEKLISLAFAYIQEHDLLPRFWRIDVVAVQLGSDRKVSRIEVIKNAIEGGA